jgi:hypothetical protein
MVEQLYDGDQNMIGRSIVRTPLSLPDSRKQYTFVQIPEEMPFRIRYQKLKNKIDLSLTPLEQESWQAKGHVTTNILDNLRLPVSIPRDGDGGADAILLPSDIARVAQAGFGKCKVLADGRFFINLIRDEADINHFIQTVFDIELLRVIYGITDLGIGINNGYRNILERRLRPDLLFKQSQIWVEQIGS